MELEWVWDNESQDQWIRVFWSESYWVAFIDAIKGKDGDGIEYFQRRCPGIWLRNWNMAFFKLEISAQFQQESRLCISTQKHIAI
jgi:hypothetical protein